jgi:hypothetical protein
VAIDWKKVKQANSKSELVEGLKVNHYALEWYARPENWQKVEGNWVWIGDDLPFYAAQVTIGLRKPDPNYKNNWQKLKEAGEHGRAGQTNTEDRGGDALLEREHKGDAGS